MMKLRVLWIVGVILVATSLVAQAIPVRSGHVNDYAARLSVNLITQLEEFLDEYETNTGIDVNVLLVQDMEGMDVPAYDAAVTEAWGLGENHILLFIALNDSAIHISKGEALEEEFPDELLQEALDSMIPLLSQGNFDSAIRQGVGRLIGVPAEIGSELPRNSQQDSGPNLFRGPLRLVILGGALALSLVFYFLFLA